MNLIKANCAFIAFWCATNNLFLLGGNHENSAVDMYQDLKHFENIDSKRDGTF